MKRIEELVGRLDDFQQGHRVVAVVVGVIKKFGDDNAGTLVVNLAYSGFVALFPLLLVMVTVLGLVLADDPSARHAVLSSTFSRFPVVGSQLSHNIHALRRSSVVGLVVGLIGLLWGSMALAQSGQFAMAQIWNLPGDERPGFAARLLRSVGFLAVLASGLVLGTFLSGFSTFGTRLGLGWAEPVAAVVLGAAVNVTQFLLAYRMLTPKSVSTRQLLAGSILGGLGWTALQALGGYLVGHQLRGAGAVYGMFAIVLGLLAWLYLGCQVVVYSAELNVVLHRRLWPRSLRQPALTPADRESLRLQAAQTRQVVGQKVEVSFSTQSEGGPS